MSINQRVKDLRQEMQKQGVQAVIVPSSDPHMSEYTPTRYQGRAWISGFTGSAGVAVVTQDAAYLWTDSRYFLQAETELADTPFELRKPTNRYAPEHITDLASTLPAGSKVAIDGWVVAHKQVERYRKILAEHDIELVTSVDVLGSVWQDRPALPSAPVFELTQEYAGKSRADKLADIREVMAKDNAAYHLVSTLDDIAWILNLRGSDVEFNPVFVSYLLVGRTDAWLFTNPSRIPSAVQDALATDQLTIRPYDDILSALNTIDEDQLLRVDPSWINHVLYRAINGQIQEGKAYSTLMKSKKNETELSHLRNAMAKDGAAIARTFYWIEQELEAGNKITEYDVAVELAQNRATHEGYQGESFPAIVGYKGNGAIIHYRPDVNDSAQIHAEGLLLVDSGGQYTEGTTDITRTIALSQPSKEAKRHFTLVLKGMIALSRATFPVGTSGAQLDVLARMHLWEHGLNYGHGTGHGVGYFLNVHEGPQSISPSITGMSKTPLEVGMITSNEPGYYLEGSYGIRVENIILTRAARDEGYLDFETLTLYPIDIRLIDEAIFTKSEKAWLNNYHQRVWKHVSPLLDGAVKDWFELRCRPMN